MPLDMATAEFAATDADGDLPENLPSHHVDKSSLLSAMKHAGRSILKRAKQGGRKKILSAMLMAGAALVTPHASKAQSVQYFEVDGVGSYTVASYTAATGWQDSQSITGAVKAIYAFDPSLYGQYPDGIATSTNSPIAGTPWITLFSVSVNGQDVTAALNQNPSPPPGQLAATVLDYQATSGPASGPNGTVQVFIGQNETYGYYLDSSIRSCGSPTANGSTSWGTYIWTPSLGVTNNQLVAGLPIPSGTPLGSYLTIYDGSESNECVANLDTATGAQVSSSITSSTLLASPPPPVTPPKTLGDPNKGDCGCAGDPITIGTGNVFERIVDYTTIGQNPLAFTRYYNSMQNASNPNTFASTMGANWRSNYDRYLNVASGGSAVSAERPDGQVLNFTLNGSTWKSDSDVDLKLVQSGSTWTLTDHNDTIETYSVASGKGTLTSITARDGYTQSLSYSGALLNSVTDSYGRSLNFTYNSGLMNTVTTPDSLVLTYGFTAAAGGNQLTSVSYNTSPTTNQTYLYENATFPFALTGVVNENGNRFATWGYDSLGRGTSSQRGTGASTADLTTLAYNGNGTTTVTNPFTVADTYTFASLQGVPKVTQINRAATATTASATETIGYDSNGYANSKTDWNGNLTTFVNDSHGDPTTINEAVGTSAARTTTIAYDGTWMHLPDTITTPGKTTSFTYDSSGNTHTATETDTTTGTVPYSTNGTARTWTMTYTGTGQLQTVTGPRTDLTQFGYSGGTLTSITDPLSHVTTVNTYTGGGLPTKITDPNGVVTTLAYDGRLNLNTSTLSTTAGPLVTTYTHDAANNLTQVTLPDSSYLAFTLDTANRPTEITNALGETINYTLDALGNRTSTAVKNSGGTTTLTNTATFDALGRMLTGVGASGQTTTSGYDPNSNLTSVQDPRGNTTTLSYDALNRPTSMTDRLSHTTTAAYDAHNAVTSMTDPNSNTTTYTRDGFERTIQLASPDSGTSKYYYDLADNMTQKTDGAGVVTNRTFDAANREVTRTFPGNAAENVYKTYDQTGAWGFGIGRLTTMSNTTTLSTSLYTRYIAYDERGNDIGGADVLGGGAFWFNNSKHYDNASRLYYVTDPYGWTTGWNRDAAGQVTGVGVVAPGSSTIVNVAGSSTAPITHMPFGPVASVPFGNGITRTNTYDLDYRLTNMTDNGSSTMLNLSYSYDANGNVGGTTGTPGIVDALNAANTQTMTYDKMDRLLTAASGSGGYGSYAWTYDANGNRTSQTLNGGTPDNYSYFSGTNRLSSTSATGYGVSYNGAGATSAISLWSSPLFSSTWNQSEQQAAVTATGSSYPAASYNYDGFGQRLVKTTAIATGFSYGKLGNLTEETNTVGQTTDYIPLDPSSRRDAYNPVGMIAIPAYPLSSSTALYFMHTDRLGTPQKVTDTSQNVQWSTTYTPFGAAASAITNPNNITQNLRLPGMYSDPETGLYHNGAREYVPITGLYFKTDPIGLAGGTNTYQYARANPFRYTDRLGLDPAQSFNGASVQATGNFASSMNGKYNLFNPNDANSDIFDAQPSVPGVLIIGGHGSPYGIADPNSPPNTSSFTADQLADQIIMATNPNGSPTFTNGNRIWLQSCKTGQTPTSGQFLGTSSTNESFAQTLANTTGSTVWAPTADSVFDSTVGEPLRWFVAPGGTVMPFFPRFKF